MTIEAILIGISILLATPFAALLLWVGLRK
jgi:hypothetical protein